MCAPAAMLVVAGGITAAGGLYQASQERAAGKAEQGFYDQNAKTSRDQADIAIKVGEQRDTLAQDQGAFNSKIVSRSYAVQKAAQQAVLAANGQGGSVGEQNIMNDTMDKRALDEAAVKYNADSKSWEAKTGAAYEAWKDRADADQYTRAGVNARKAANAKARGTLLSTAGQIAGMGLTYGMYAAGGASTPVMNPMWNG